MFANEYDIERYLVTFAATDTPNLYEGARVLTRLATWANGNSDGWAYWAKPRNSARRLVETMESAQRDFRGGRLKDISDAELTKALAPVKSFLTRQGVDHGEVL